MTHSLALKWQQRRLTHYCAAETGHAARPRQIAPQPIQCRAVEWPSSRSLARRSGVHALQQRTSTTQQCSGARRGGADVVAALLGASYLP
eukprot:6182803-Pleurochrysis_carterae.AAC.2